MWILNAVKWAIILNCRYHYFYYDATDLNLKFHFNCRTLDFIVHKWTISPTFFVCVSIQMYIAMSIYPALPSISFSLFLRGGACMCMCVRFCLTRTLSLSLSLYLTYISHNFNLSATLLGTFSSTSSKTGCQEEMISQNWSYEI